MVFTYSRILGFYCDRIAQNSPIYAGIVKKEIIETVDKLSQNTFQYQIDEYYPENNGNIRRFFRWSYRVVYQVSNSKL